MFKCCVITSMVIITMDMTGSALSVTDILSAHFRPGFVKNITSSIIMSCDISQSKQCEKICVMTFGCQSFFYNPVTDICQFHSRVFHSSDGNIHQSKPQLKYFYRQKDSNLTSSNVCHSVKRILVVPRFTDTWQNVTQLFQSDGSQERYLYMMAKFVRDVVYTCKLRQVLIALKFHDTILSLPLDSHGNKTLKKNVMCRSMAVDEGRQLVFMVTLRPPRVCRMTTAGGKFTVIKIFHSFAGSIAVFPDKKIVFVAFQRQIRVIYYNGKSERVLVKDVRSSSLSFDSFGNSLYYNNGRNVMMINMSNYTTVKIRSFEYSSMQLVYHQQALYVKVYPGSDLFIIDTVHNTTRINTNIQSSANKWRFCLIT